MDDLQKKALGNLPEPIRTKLSKGEDLIEEMAKLSEADLKRISVSITALVEHTALMADKPRRKAQKDGDRIHAKIERQSIRANQPESPAKCSVLRAVR
tara:strand:+ start:435 stop:728 length:294 start_codon:yes stop_codon:yes gene_type:complete